MPGNETLFLDAVHCNSIIPAVDQHGVAPYFRFGDQEIWTSSGGGGPAIITLSPTNSELLHLTGHCVPELIGHPFSISSTWEGFTEGLQTPTTTYNSKLEGHGNSFKISLPVSGMNVPWGFKGCVTWTVRLTDELHGELPIDIPTFTTTIELYAVSPWCYEFLACDGIPLDFLRFFVLPTRGDDDYVTEYAPHVVTQVHYHSGFRYNRVSGVHRYVDHNPWRFALSRWLKDLDRNKTAVHKYTLNCIDLAQIVGIATSLGFKNAEEANALEWSSLIPFGFINKTHLIGFTDDVNSPFVDKHGNDNSLVKWDSKPRSCFSGHWFIIWHNKVFDATCGPQLGLLGIDKYIETAIDSHYSHEHHPGIINGTIKDLSRRPFSPGLDGPVPEHEAISGYDETWLGKHTKIADLVSSLQPKGQVKILIDTLVNILNDRCGPTYVLEPAEPFELNMDPRNPGLGITIRWPISCEHSGVVGTLDLQITVFDTPEQALDRYTTDLRMAARKIQEPSPNLSRGTLVHVTENPHSVHAVWSYGHLFVNLMAHGLGEQEVVPIVHELQVYLEEVGAESHPVPPMVKSSWSETGNVPPTTDTMAFCTSIDIAIEVPPPISPIVIVVLIT